MASDVSVGAAIVDTTQNQDLERCRLLCEQQCDQVEVVIDNSIGLAEARNQAAARLNTDVYAFIDSDAYPSRCWGDELRQGYREGALAVGGPAMHPNRWLPGNIPVPTGWEWLVGIGPFHTEKRWVRNTYGCNYSMRSAVFDSLGGFNPRFGKGSRVPHGEETELAKRLHDTYGERMQYRPGAVVFHRIHHEDRLPGRLLRRAYDQGVTKGVLGVDSEESGFLREQLRQLTPWRACLLAAVGTGYLRGKLTKPLLES